MYYYNEDWSDATLRWLLSGTRLERKPMTKGEMRYEKWGYKTRKQVLRDKNKDMDKENEGNVWYGLVVPEGKTFHCDEQEHCSGEKKKSKSWGLVDPVAQPAKDYSGSVRCHREGIVRGGLDSVYGQTGQVNESDTIVKKKNKNKSCH